MSPIWACARRLLAARDVFYPQLATHNAHTVAAVKAYASEGIGGAMAGFEFQRLHGMGEALYDVVREDCALPCRVYAPVGSHADLLPYLVRRLLENGANTSFVNRIFDEDMPPEQLVADPVAFVRALAVKPNPGLPLPCELFGATRRNSAGLNLADELAAATLSRELQLADVPSHAASLCYDGLATRGTAAAAVQAGRSPRTDWRMAAVRCGAGCRMWSPPRSVLSNAGQRHRWSRAPRCSNARPIVLKRSRAPFLRLLVTEAGKTLPDAIAEVREAVDFLRYYAASARRLLAHPEALPGPTGEHNELQLHGRGLFVCISPWNFPLAIFVGQIAAALVAGNPVIAKPAEQTPLIASLMAQLLRAAGVPSYVFQCLLGDGALGAALVASPQVAGVAFTGSSEVARAINRTPGRTPGADRHADRRNRRPERDDRRLLGTARAGGQGRDALGLRLRRPALLGGCACCTCRTTSPTRPSRCCAARCAN